MCNDSKQYDSSSSMENGVGHFSQPWLPRRISELRDSCLDACSMLFIFGEQG